MSREGAADGQPPRPSQTLEVVFFRWGPLHFGVPAYRVLALESVREPGPASIGDLLGLAPLGPATSAGAPRRLRVAGPGGTLRIEVQEPVIRVSLPAAAIHPLPPLLAARLRLPWVRALASGPAPGLAPGALIVILDPGHPKTA